MVDAIKDIIAKQLQIDADMIDDDADIVDDLGADSLDVVEMLMAVEVTLGFSVPDDQIVNMKTVRDIIDYIELHSDAGFDYKDTDENEEIL